jgi:hypothetical protein
MHNYWKRRGSEWVRIAERTCRCRTCGRDTWPRQPMYGVRAELGNDLSLASLYFCAECVEKHFAPSLFDRF